MEIRLSKEHIKKLRNKQRLNFFDRKQKLFVTFQFNSEEKSFVCWKRFVSKDNRNFVCWNEFLNLKDINNIYTQLIKTN